MSAATHDQKLANCAIRATAFLLGWSAQSVLDWLSEFHAGGAGEGDGWFANGGVDTTVIDLALMANGWRPAVPVAGQPFPIPGTALIHQQGHSWALKAGTIFDTAYGAHFGTEILRVLCPKEQYAVTYAEPERRGWLFRPPRTRCANASRHSKARYRASRQTKL